MNIDISRDSFDDSRNYSGVLIQQGRALVDAEWNEQVAVINSQMRKSFAEITKDLGPRYKTLEAKDNAIQVSLTDGTFFVAGVRCDAKEKPYLSCPFKKIPNDWVLSVHAWESFVTGMTDTNLHDPALALSDSGLRTRIDWNLQVDIGNQVGDYQNWIDARRGKISVSRLSENRGQHPSLYTIEIAEDSFDYDEIKFRLSRDGVSIQPSKLPSNWEQDSSVEIDGRLKVTFERGSRVYRTADRWVIPFRAPGNLHLKSMLPSGQHYYSRVVANSSTPIVERTDCRSIEVFRIAAQTIAASAHCSPLMCASGLMQLTQSLPLKKWLSTALLLEITGSSFEGFLMKVLSQLPIEVSRDPEFQGDAKYVWNRAHEVNELLTDETHLESITPSA